MIAQCLQVHHTKNEEPSAALASIVQSALCHPHNRQLSATHATGCSRLGLRLIFHDNGKNQVCAVEMTNYHMP